MSDELKNEEVKKKRVLAGNSVLTSTEDDEPAADDDDDDAPRPPSDPNAGLGLDADGVLRVVLPRRFIPVEADFDGSGNIKQYTILQMTGSEKGEYQEAQSKLIVFNKKGFPVGMKPNAVRDSDIDLICRCLIVGNWTSSDQPVQRVRKIAVETWSAEAIDKIARVCEKLNCVGKEAARLALEAEDNAKKD